MQLLVRLTINNSDVDLTFDFTDDETEKDVTEPIPMGPRGGGWIASVDVHMAFDADAPRIIYWSSHGVGADVLARIDDLSTGFLKEILKKVAGGAPPR